jgi:O-antigen/teichoic acid export membrane protein
MTIRAAVGAKDRDAYLRRVAIASLVNSVVSASSTAVLLPYLIRSVGLETYGVWAMLVIFVGIAAVLDFGIWKSLVYLLPQKGRSAGELAGSAIALCSLGGLAFSLVLVGLLAAGVPVFGYQIAARGDLAWWLAITGCLVLILSLFTNLARGVLEAQFRAEWVNLLYAALTLAQMGAVTLVARYTHDLRALLLGSVATYAAILGAHLACLSQGALRDLRIRRSAVEAILKYGSRSFLADLPANLIGPLLLYLFVLTVADSARYGVFDIALRIATLAGTALGLLSAPFFALVSAAHPRAHSEIRTAISRQIRLAAVLALAGVAAYGLIGGPMVALFFHERSAEIFRASLIMTTGSVAVAALEPVARMMMGIGRLGLLSLLRFAMLGGSLLSVAVLAHYAPLDRFAISTAIGFGILAIGLVVANRCERWGREAAAVSP